MIRREVALNMAGNRSDDSPFADWDIDSDDLSLGPSNRPAGRARTTSTAVARDFDLDAPSLEAPRTVMGRDAKDDPGGLAPRPSAPSPAPLPRVGDQIGGFRLVAELGRGAFARVFLAEEVSLGGRRVALKVSAPVGDEPQILARLQHAHIVPVHSVRDDPETGLRLLCMPYLGGANLAQVLEEAWSEGESTRGASLVDALDQLSLRLPPQAAESLAPGRRSLRRSQGGGSLRLDPAGPPPPAGKPRPAGPSRPSRRFAPFRWMADSTAAAADGAAPPGDGPDEDLLPSRKFLRRANLVRSAVWVAARLAEGLEHAHSRGLLHRDLKPSNVLIAADGTPMLLDFNLSVEVPHPEREGGEAISRAMLGGTLPYMAPEHLDALDPKGTTPPDAVDERSDLYSLGLILFEMLAGEQAFAAPSTSGGSLATLRKMVEERRRRPPSIRRLVPGIPPSLAALVSKCLDPDPARRHQDAGELAEDLRRFLDDMPMKYGPEPSLAERARKWTRRHPAAFSSSSTAAAAVVLIALALAGPIQVFEAMQGLHARLKLRTFRRDAIECRFLLNTFGDDDVRIKRGLNLASVTLATAGVDESKGVYGGPWIARLGADERREVRATIVELILQDAHAWVVLAGREGSEARRAEAIVAAVNRLDGLARGVSDPPGVLYRRRARYRAALGDAPGAAADEAAAAARPPATSEEWTWLGMFQLSEGQVDEAEESLREALSLDVTSFWAWFAQGHCHYEQRRFGEAVEDFTASVVARPDFAWSHFNRGLALDRAARPREALDAFSRAVALDPSFVEARVDRGLVELELDMPAKAEADLRSGLSGSRTDPRLVAALADALVRQGEVGKAERLFDDLLRHSPSADLRAARGVIRLRTDPAAAAKDFAAALAAQPANALAHYGMARVLRGSDRGAALRHLDRALAAEPDLFDAVELRALERAREGDRSALHDVARLVAYPSANRLYNAACALAILGEDDRAVDLLGRAIRSGFPAPHAATDPDLAPIRHRQDFRAALARKPSGG